MIYLLWHQYCFDVPEKLIREQKVKTKFKLLCGAVALAMAGHVAADTSWTVSSSTPANISSGVTVAAYSNTGGTNGSANALNNAASQTIQTATWNPTYGGIANADACTSGSYCDYNEGISPEHAIDNNQRYDMALLDFSATGSVNLKTLKLGWAQYDSDVTVMAYTGAAPFSTANKLIGATYAQLIGLGWQTIGNYANVGTANNLDLTGANTQTLSAGKYSSYWLVGAYNPLAAGTTVYLASSSTNGSGTDPTGSSLGVGNDNIKLASVGGIVCTGGTGPNCTPGKVPEPGSLALVGFALMGMMGLRKRRQA